MCIYIYVYIYIHISYAHIPPNSNNSPILHRGALVEYIFAGIAITPLKLATLLSMSGCGYSSQQDHTNSSRALSQFLPHIAWHAPMAKFSDGSDMVGWGFPGMEHNETHASEKWQLAHCFVACQFVHPEISMTNPNFQITLKTRCHWAKTTRQSGRNVKQWSLRLFANALGIAACAPFSGEALGDLSPSNATHCSCWRIILLT